MRNVKKIVLPFTNVRPSVTLGHYEQDTDMREIPVYDRKYSKHIDWDIFSPRGNKAVPFLKGSIPESLNAALLLSQ